MHFFNFKLALRSLVKFKFYSLSTIIGFGTALTIGIVTTSFYVYEKHTDDFIDPSVYRVLMNHPITRERQVVTYHELAPKLKSDFPEIEESTHIYYPGYLTLFANANLGLKEKGAIYCDENFFRVFNYSLFAGNSATCLKDPNSIVLTKERAFKYFGSLEVLNKVIVIDKNNYTVTGVLDEPPSNTHLKLSVLLSYSSLPLAEDALDYGGCTYIKLNSKSTILDVEMKLNQHRSQLLSFKPDQWPVDPFRIESVSEAYYHQNYDERLQHVFRFRNKQSVNVYPTVSLVIFIVALVNFAIYFYSKTTSNSKQLIIKRIFGVSETSVLFSFITEIFLVLTLSFLLGTGASIFLLPLFNEWAVSSIPLLFGLSFQVVTIIFLIILTAAFFLGGIFYLLFFKMPGSIVFQGKVSSSFSQAGLLRGLMIVQLTFSTTLLLLFFMIMNQIKSINNYSIGYDRNNLIEIDLSSFSAESNPQTIKAEFLKNINVKAGTICFGGPMTGRWHRNISYNNENTDFGYYQVDADFVTTLGIEVVNGKDFEPYFSNDSSYLLVNETAADFFDIKNNIDSLRSDLPVSGKISGVFKDFHYASLKNKVAPAFLLYVPYKKLGPFGGKLIVRVNHVNGETISSLESTWNNLSNISPMEYTVLSDEYTGFYQNDLNESKLLSISVFGILLVTCFGVIGFTYFSAQKRLKEMAIRKVLGASEPTIYLIWAKTLAAGVFLASLIAVPSAFYFINKWTSDFIYKQPVSVVSIPLALLSVIIAVCISSYYIIRQSTIQSITETLKQD